MKAQRVVQLSRAGASEIQTFHLPFRGNILFRLIFPMDYVPVVPYRYRLTGSLP